MYGCTRNHLCDIEPTGLSAPRAIERSSASSDRRAAQMRFTYRIRCTEPADDTIRVRTLRAKVQRLNRPLQTDLTPPFINIRNGLCIRSFGVPV